MNSPVACSCRDVCNLKGLRVIERERDVIEREGPREENSNHSKCSKIKPPSDKVG